MVLLVLLLVVLPVAEFSAMVWVAQQVGFLTMLGLLFAVSIFGGLLAKRVGIEVWRRFRATLAAGDIPSGEVFDGALVLIAAAILLVPGFITDVIGLLLLVPFVRSMVKWAFWRRMRGRLIAATERMGTRRQPPIKVQAIRLVDSGDQGGGPGDWRQQGPPTGA
ncbi:MAG TPA: FxsA family protein [Actinomycetota bacterium]|nr:FxsA family protein [Actinomycetota bacterium]